MELWIWGTSSIELLRKIIVKTVKWNCKPLVSGQRDVDHNTLGFHLSIRPIILEGSLISMFEPIPAVRYQGYSTAIGSSLSQARRFRFLRPVVAVPVVRSRDVSTPVGLRADLTTDSSRGVVVLRPHMCTDLCIGSRLLSSRTHAQKTRTKGSFESLSGGGSEIA